MKYNEYKLSWKPDVPDHRDYSFRRMSLDKQLTFSISDSLPVSISLRRWCTEVEDQQSLGSCVANSIIGMLEFNQCKRGMGGPKLVQLSRLFNYYNSRVLGDNVNEDSGAYIRDGIKTAKLNGVCPANDWPYRINYFKAQPPTNAYSNALKFRVNRYYRLHTLQEMKTVLANGHVFVFGAAIYPSFFSEIVETTGNVQMPSIFEPLLGGHAMMAIGYNDVTQKFLVRNSWGKNWGILDGSNLAGYCWFPYKYLESRDLSDDFWTAF